MQPVAPMFRERCSAEVPSPLRIPMLSTVTAEYLSAAPDADYWSRHLVAPVCFAEACTALAQADEPWLGLEVGPRPSLAPLAEQQIAAAGKWLACASTRPDDDAVPLLEGVGAAWLHGCPVNLPALREAETRHVSLPPYPFAKTAFWHRPVEASSTAPAAGAHHVPAAAARRAPAASAQQAPAAAAHQAPAATAHPAAEKRPQADKNHAEIAIVIMADVIGIDPADIRPEHRIAEDLGLDSVNVIEVVGRLREAIGEDAMPPLDAIAEVVTVRDLTHVLSANLVPA
jgi:acyl transferase domain-containing protein